MIKVSEETKDAYRRILRSRREDESEQIVANRYPWHCKIAISELMEHAIQLQKAKTQADPVIARLLTGTCNDHIYGNEATVRKIEQFVEIGGRLRVLVWAERLDWQCQLAKMAESSSNIELQVSGTSVRGEELSHFFVVDEKSFRYEQAHPPVEAQKFRDFTPEIPASICFNDPKHAKQLVRFFDDIWAVFQSASQLDTRAATK